MADPFDVLADLIEREHELAHFRAKLDPILDGFEVVGPVRAEMVADPERALRIAEHVLNSRGVRKAGALMIHLWRQSSATPEAPEAPEAEESAPPTLSALEYAWSRDGYGTPLFDTLLGAMASAIAAAGGFAAIRESFTERELYDPDGNLLERAPA